MAESSQHHPAHLYDGVAIRDLYVTASRAIDQSPKEVELLHGLAIRVLHKKYGTKVDLPQHALVQELYPLVVEAVSASKEAQAALDKIVERYGNLPSTEAIRLAKPGQNSIAHAIVVGVVLGLIIVGVVCLYLAAKY